MAHDTSWSERIRAARPKRWAFLKRIPRRWLAAGGGASAVTAVALVILILASLGPDRRRRAAPGPPPERAGVLVESGQLRSATVTPVYVFAEGEIAWLIDEGAIVEPGTVIARIESSSLESRFEQHERDHVPRQTEVQRAEQELASARTLGPLTVRRAEIQLAKAEWELEDLRLRPTQEELEGARIDLRVAELARQKAASDLERATALAKRGFATDAEIRDRRLKALDAEVEAELAKLRLDLVSLGATELSIEAAKLAVGKAKLTVEEASFASEADAVIAEKALDVAKAYLAAGERQLEHLKSDLENAQVKANAPGRVTFPEVWRWTKDATRVEVGETVRWGQQICEIADPSRLQARVYVNEVDSPGLAEGLPARARLAAYPGVEVPGRVARVGRSAGDKNDRLGDLALRKAGKAGVGVVEVLVDLDFAAANADAASISFDPANLRGGHSVTVEIDVEAPPAPKVPSGPDAIGAGGEGGGPDG